jgi:lysozyme family protein
MARVNFTQALRDEDDQLFALASIRPERAFDVDSVVRRILEPTSWAKYQQVESSTGVPAYVVGIIHNLEASLNFKSHLHNGDPLTARTVRVPRGRPLGRPPFDWDASAADALKLKKLDQWSDWSIAGIAYLLETYNGMGYRLYHPHVKSPYLWSFSSIYSSGKYVADGTWSDSAVSAQCGGMAALKRMMELGHVNLPQPAPAADRGEATITPFAEAGTPATPAAAAPPHYPGRPLKTGSSGADVVRLQEQLRMLGVTEIGGADGDFGERTEHAVRLFQARAVDEAGVPLEIDGIAGAKTWRALFGVGSIAAVSSDLSAASRANGFHTAVLEDAASRSV